jgi:hypothetical protein
MNLRRTISLALVGAALTSAIAVPAVSAAEPPASAVDILLADGDTYDRNWYDYDILAVAAGAVLGAKPDSKVGELADGTIAKTVFAPNDRAFQVLVASLTGRWYWSEEKVVTKLLESLGTGAIDTLEAVILYHVVDGTIDYNTAKSLAPVNVASNLGPEIGVRYNRWLGILYLVDQDRNALNPWVIKSQRDLNLGNPQIIHGISLVLRPMDLPPLAR